MRLLTTPLAALAGLAALGILGASSCSGGSGGSGGPSEPLAAGSGHLTIEVTDAPFEHDMVDEARIRVDRVTVHASQSEDSGWHTIYSGAPLDFDLLDLRNGVTRTLVNLAEVPAGRYKEMRLRVVGGRLLLTNGNEYTTADDSLRLTSTDTSGLKIKIRPALEIEDGFSRTLMLDFDLTKTFRPIPANDPMNADHFKLGPVIRTANLSNSGELRGIVTQNGGADEVADATVYVLPEGEPDPDESIASTATNENGSWAVIGIAPGTYDVLARHGDLEARADAQPVSSGSATLVVLDLE